MAEEVQLDPQGEQAQDQAPVQAIQKGQYLVQVLDQEGVLLAERTYWGASYATDKILESGQKSIQSGSHRQFVMTDYRGYLMGILKT